MGEPAKEETGSKSELKIWRERYTSKGGAETVEVSSLDLYNGLHEFDDPFALVVIQVFNDKHVYDKTKLKINSPHILKAFREVIVSYPTIPVDFSNPFEMISPFKGLYHHWDSLFKYRDNLEDAVARKHLDILCEFMDVSMGPEKRRILAMVDKGQIDFDSVWTIFKPGEIVITDVQGHPWQLKLIKTAYSESKCDGKFLEVHQSFTFFDGTDVVRGVEITKIREKDNFPQGTPGDIDDLDVRPCQFDGSCVSQDELVKRGKKHLDLKAKSVHYYNGFAQYLKPPPSDFFDPDMDAFEHVWFPYTETGRVIVDPKTFAEDFKTQRGVKIHEITDSDLSLCSPFVIGYSLDRKQWSRLYLPYLQQVEWRPDPYASLVVPDQQIHLIQALVHSHRYPDNPRDAMDQKGKGLVALLHGPPGSGKTLTAECAAEESHRALLSTSLSELNTDNFAPLFEANLKSVLRLATSWKAIVLFDEADVFLETRAAGLSQQDTDRNAIVAVFLRHLEYFSGIVFLTTNRVKVFDAAMKSRVHLALGYEPAGKESLRRIWTNALRKLPESDRDIDVDVVSKELVRHSVNGREVSNTINTAYTLARFEGKPLKQAHLETVLGMRKQFEATLSGE
ncbi:related to TOB3 (member of AAA-ATPase family) [Ramularia collo-cygni]|uniref:Related to TOB3 (Member of AAA-ATPase family) n=1 Tax=Ramularia collo-cygni TaxID=112498 RepID=A0A2D3UPD7_9PEZI|nr:related to TOB3 (member of AAA-ATPase family) [Ramularia collo-cygni]CZT14695.1 related to TOB3 (member of AAA-ATPase family) [Ramularia collo-cygni]